MSQPNPTLSSRQTPQPIRVLIDLGRRLVISEYFVLILAVVMFLIALPFFPRIGSLTNLQNVASNMWPLLAIAVGQTVVLITAGIDLSQIAVMAMTSTLGSMLMATTFNPILFDRTPLWGSFISEGGGLLAGNPWAVPLAIIAMLLVGALIGLLNGFFIARVNIPPFMMTFLSLTLFSSVAVWLTRAENVTSLPQAFLDLGRSSGVPFLGYPMFIALGVAIVMHLILQRTVLGQWIYAVGRNPRAAVISGVPKARVLMMAYMFSSVCATIGGILYTARLGMGRPGFGQGFDLLLDVIGATVIGGTSLFGGRGKILWTVFGVLLFVLLSNILNFMNLSYFTVNIVKGCFILFAALLDVARRRMQGIHA